MSEQIKDSVTPPAPDAPQSDAPPPSPDPLLVELKKYKDLAAENDRKLK